MKIYKLYKLRYNPTITFIQEYEDEIFNIKQATEALDQWFEKVMHVLVIRGKNPKSRALIKFSKFLSFFIDGSHLRAYGSATGTTRWL